MQKQLGENVKVLGIEGNFDDAQSALKNIFVSDLRDEALEKESCSPAPIPLISAACFHRSYIMCGFG